MNKKGVQTLTSLTLTMLLAIGLFTGVYLYISANVASSGITPPATYENYTTSYDTLQEKQAGLDRTLGNVSDAVNAVNEAETTAFAVWNGMKGIGTALKVPIQMIDLAISGMSAFLFSDELLPVWIKVLLALAILAIIIYTVLGALKGEARL